MEPRAGASKDADPLPFRYTRIAIAVSLAKPTYMSSNSATLAVKPWM